MVRPDDDKVAQGLALHLRKALRDAGETGRVLHLAHSGGALITYLAAKHHLASNETDCIDVATFGAARSITRKYFRNRAVNYYARNDPLIRLDGRASELLKWADPEVGDIMEVNYLKHNTTFIFMEGRARAGLRDHSLEGPTYRAALEIEASEFLGRTATTCGRERRRNDIIKQARHTLRLMRKKAARVTGLRHFFSAPLNVFRKLAARTTGMRGVFSGIVAPLSPIPTTHQPQPYYMDWWEKEIRGVDYANGGPQTNEAAYIETSTDDDEEASEGVESLENQHFPSQQNQTGKDGAEVQNKTGEKLAPPSSDFLGKGGSSWWREEHAAPQVTRSSESVAENDVHIVKDTEIQCNNSTVDYAVCDDKLTGS